MVIELRPPSGPGLPAPSFEKSWQQSSFFDEPNLKRVLDAPYYEDFVRNAVGPKPIGSIEGGPSFSQAYDILHPDPRKWSTIESPRSLTAPVLSDLGGKASGDASSKLGRFDLNLVKPFDSLREGWTEGLGQQAATFEPFEFDLGETVFGDTHFSPMDVLNWSAETPVKLVERPLAFLQVAASRILGTPVPTDTEGDAVYPFQKDPAYWDWLRSATEEQLTQFARAQAGQYLSPGRNGGLYDVLLARFHEDANALIGLTSGSSEIDWHAKVAAWNAQSALRGTLGDQTVLGKMRASNVENPIGGFVGTLIGTVPFIGTNLQSWVDPVTPEMDAYWSRLSVAERQKHLEEQGYVTVAKNLLGMIPTFNAAAAIGMAAKTSSAPAIVNMAKAWSLTLRSAEVLMASGVAISTASWAAETFAPYTDIGQFGRDVNLAAPISGDVNASLVVSNIAGIASGSFGAILAVRTVARGAGMLRAHAPISVHLWGTSELPFYSEGFGGSEYGGFLREHAGVPDSNARLAVDAALKNYVIGAAEADLLRAGQLSEAGISVHPDLDALPVGQRVAYFNDQVARLYASRGARVAQMVDRFDRFRRALPLQPSTNQVAAHAANRLGIRNLVDAATRSIREQYGPAFFGADRAAIRSRVEQGLRELGYEPDMVAFDAKIGRRDNPATVDAWLKMARLVHQLGYVTENGRLKAAIDAHPGSTETGLALFSQRTPFADEMRNAIGILRGGDQAAARAYAKGLIAQKIRLDDLYAIGQFRDASKKVADPDPIALADHLQDVLEHGGFPERRTGHSDDPATADLPLNVFHRELEGKGKWELGYRAKRPIEAALTLAASLERELSAVEFANYHPELVTLVDVIPAGYIELLPGQKFRRKNWYALKPIRRSDGSFWVLDDGTLVNINAAPAAGATPIRPSNDPTSPYPFDPYAGAEGAEAYDLLPDKQKILVKAPDKSGGNFTKAPLEYDLEPTGEVMSGRNAGADWPVLEHGVTGEKYLFKADRSSGGPVSQEPYRRLAAPTATKLFRYFGLHTPEEIPFSWGGVKGTIQKLVEDVEPVLLNHLYKYNRETHAELIKHHIVDWLTGQHDSNSDSMLAGGDGYIYGVDKGQAYKYFYESEPTAVLQGANGPDGFFDFRTRDAADTHLGEYLLDAINRSELEFRWEDIAPLLDEIDALPDDIYLAALRPLAEARVAAGKFEANVQHFYDVALEHKRSIRNAATNAFSHHDYATLHPGRPPTFAPGARGLVDIGGPVRLNEEPIELSVLLDENAAHPVAEPAPPATVDHYKAGVVVQEPDGRVWIIAPKSGYGGYSHSWPKGGIEAGESFQAAAIREAYEETGLSVVLDAHLADLPNDAGNITRYYLATRASGGPEHIISGDEIGLLSLVSPEDAAGYLFRNGAPDPRDTAVLDALNQRKANAQQAAAGPPPPAITDPLPGMDEPGSPETEMGYVGHVRLRNGEMWRTPWLDPDVSAASAIELGNRGTLGRMYDGVFHGWRAWRLMEQHKLNLHHRLTRDYEITPGQVEQFHTELIGLTRQYRGASVQGLAGGFEALPYLGKAVSDVREIAESIFGEGPFLNRRTGGVDEINWPREVTKAYRQALRLNVLAGVTSHIKAIPGLGGFLIPVTDVIYPLARFGLSFIFKPSERTESALLNAGRGTWRSGDPFTDSQYARNGFGAGTGILREEAGYDMHLQGMTMFSPDGGARGRFGEDPAFFSPLDTAEYAKRVANEIAPREAFAPGPPTSRLSDSLEGGPLELADPERFPDLFPDDQRHLLEQIGVDDDGNPILQRSGGEQTQRQVGEHRARILGELLTAAMTSPDTAGRAGVGFAVLRALPPGTIERLAAYIPLIHAPGRGTGFGGRGALGSQLDYIAANIRDGNPLFSGLLSSGRFDLSIYDSLAGGKVIAADATPGVYGGTQIGAHERHVGFADAKYGSAVSPWSSVEGIVPILRPEAIKESITLDTDRINYGADVGAIRDRMMTPAAVNGINRLIAQRMVIDWAASYPELSFQEFVTQRASTYLGATDPFEFAYMQGIRADMVDAMMVPESQLADWTQFVTDHPGHGLEDLRIVPYDGSDIQAPMWANSLERAGLLDFSLTRPDDHAMLTRDEGLLSLPIELLDEALTQDPANRWLVDRIESIGSEAGLRAEVNYSVADYVQMELNSELRAAHTAKGSLAHAAALPVGTYFTETAAELGAKAATATALAGELERLLGDVRALAASTEFTIEQAMNLNTAGVQGASIDPGLLARARNYIDAYDAIAARASASGVAIGGALRTTASRPDLMGGTVRVLDAGTAEVLLDRPSSPLPFSPAFRKMSDQMSPEYPWQADKARAILEVHQRIAPRGFSVKQNGYLSSTSTRAILESIDTPELRSALRARAERKLGVPLEDPVIRGYIRGPARRLAPSGYADVGIDDLIIVVQDGAGQPYGGLSMPELNDLWQQHGLPAGFKARAEASGFDGAKAGALDSPMGLNAGYLLHGKGPRPEGRAYFYHSYSAGSRLPGAGVWQDSPLGKDYVDTNAPATFDISFMHHFEPGKQSYVELDSGRVLYRESIEVAQKGSTIEVASRDRRGDRSWAYEMHDTADGVREARITGIGYDSSVASRMEAIRDLIDRNTDDHPGGIRLTLDHTDDRMAFERLALRGETPDWLVAVDAMGKVVDKPAIVRRLNPTAPEGPLEPPPTSFTDVTPEGKFTDRIRAELARGKGKAWKTAHAWFVDPVPAKQRAMDKLTFKLMRDRFAPLLREEAPHISAIFDELDVPDLDRLDFLVHDRYLLDGWLKSGARADWEAMLLHSGKYTGKAEYKANRLILDELYSSPGFDVMLDTLRLGMKGAQDEAYQVHFFSPYRSTLERSINHPVLGIYPASWAYKVAKEWIRFLYKNETLGFRLGMTPAMAIKHITDAQAKSFAMNSDMDLDEWLEDGPYSNSIFIFNLLMPGDWSSLPFPASRVIRDAVRGEVNMNEIYERYIASVGLGRDIRLTLGAGDELLQTIAGRPGEGPRFKKAREAAADAGWSLYGDEEIPVLNPPEAPREIFQRK